MPYEVGKFYSLHCREHFHYCCKLVDGEDVKTTGEKHYNTGCEVCVQYYDTKEDAEKDKVAGWDCFDVPRQKIISSTSKLANDTPLDIKLKKKAKKQPINDIWVL